MLFEGRNLNPCRKHLDTGQTIRPTVADKSGKISATI